MRTSVDLALPLPVIQPQVHVTDVQAAVALHGGHAVLAREHTNWLNVKGQWGGERHGGWRGCSRARCTSQGTSPQAASTGSVGRKETLRMVGMFLGTL